MAGGDETHIGKEVPVKPRFLLLTILLGCYDKGLSLDSDHEGDDTDAPDDTASACDGLNLDDTDLERDDCDAAPEECRCACYAELGERDGTEAGEDCDISYPTRLHTIIGMEPELKACFQEAAMDAWGHAYINPENNCPVPVAP